MWKWKKSDLSWPSSYARRSAAKWQKADENVHIDTTDRSWRRWSKTLLHAHSVMRATKTTQQTTHFLSSPYLSNVNIAMHESFRKKPLGMCCAIGKVVLPPLPAASKPSASLLAGTHDNSKNFLRNVMRYNACFQMTSFGATRERNDEGWMPTFKVQMPSRWITAASEPCIVLCANRIVLLLSQQWQYTFYVHSLTQGNAF